MTGRERLSAILDGRPPDRPSWTALIDGASLRAMPGQMSPVEFYRQIGCDIFQLSGRSTGIPMASPEFEWPRGVQESVDKCGDRVTRELRSSGGVLTATFRKGHPEKHLVETLADVLLFRDMWEGARFAARDDSDAFRKLNELVGDDGIITRWWSPSAIPLLAEVHMGVESFYYMLHDHPREMDALITTMHRRMREAFDILAQGPCGSVTLVENTSTSFISPDLYRRYNGPHVRDFVETMHAAGKKAIIHMCGHIKNLLDDIKHTGLDGVHALTPPPTGDTPWEHALDVLGDQTLIISALDPSVFVMGPLDDIPRALDAFYTPRLRKARFIMCCFADGIVVPLERFQAVARWFKQQA